MLWFRKILLMFPAIFFLPCVFCWFPVGLSVVVYMCLSGLWTPIILLLLQSPTHLYPIHYSRLCSISTVTLPFRRCQIILFVYMVHTLYKNLIFVCSSCCSSALFCTTKDLGIILQAIVLVLSL